MWDANKEASELMHKSDIIVIKDFNFMLIYKGFGIVYNKFVFYTWTLNNYNMKLTSMLTNVYNKNNNSRYARMNVFVYWWWLTELKHVAELLNVISNNCMGCVGSACMWIFVMKFVMAGGIFRTWIQWLNVQGE